MVDCLDLDPAGMSRAELSRQMLDIEARRARLDAAAARVTQVWDAQQVWVDDGARTGAAWLRHHAGISSRRASAQIHVARDLRSMPSTAAAFEDGSLSFEKVQLLASARTNATAVLFDTFEETLVDAARTCVYDDLAKAVRHWKAWADSLGYANDAGAMVDGRRASVSETLDGAVKVDGWLDPESGELFKRVFDAIDQEFERQDQRDRDNEVGAPTRTAAQRHADALTEMARDERASRLGDAGRRLRWDRPLRQRCPGRRRGGAADGLRCQRRPGHHQRPVRDPRSRSAHAGAVRIATAGVGNAGRWLHRP